MGIMMVTARMNAVITQDMCSTPCSSPTMVGSAVEKMVWLSEDMSWVRINPTNSRVMVRWWSIWVVPVVSCAVVVTLGGSQSA